MEFLSFSFLFVVLVVVRKGQWIMQFAFREKKEKEQKKKKKKKKTNFLNNFVSVPMNRTTTRKIDFPIWTFQKSILWFSLNLQPSRGRSKALFYLIFTQQVNQLIYWHLMWCHLWVQGPYLAEQLHTTGIQCSERNVRCRGYSLLM